jgi:hypothetical protein
MVGHEAVELGLRHLEGRQQLGAQQASRQARRRSCAPSSMGEPQTTISGSPMSTPHQRVARHLAATSWLTRSLPMKNTSGSPEEPPVLKRFSGPVAGALKVFGVGADVGLGEQRQALQVGEAGHAAAGRSRLAEQLGSTARARPAPQEGLAAFRAAAGAVRPAPATACAPACAGPPSDGPSAARAAGTARARRSRCRAMSCVGARSGLGGRRRCHGRPARAGSMRRSQVFSRA